MSIITTLTPQVCHQLIQQLQQADRILVGLGHGMSIAGGLPQQYPIDGASTDYWSNQAQDQQDDWSYWHGYLQHIRFTPQVTAPYQHLMALLADKDYFVITTNVDGQLAKSGAHPQRIYTAQGDMARLQCSKNCQQQTYPARKFLQQDTSTIAVPRCTHCGSMLVGNVNFGKHFCHAPYQQQEQRFFRFVNGSSKSKLVLLEIGVGYQTPQIIRFPFEHILGNHKQCTLLRINLHHPLAVEENQHKATCLAIDAATLLAQLQQPSQS